MSFRPKLMLALSLAVATALRAEIKVGDAFPDLSAAGVVNLSGGAVPALAGHVVLVDFWASWCAPCKASFPAFANLHAEYAGKGVLILAVALDEQHDALRNVTAFVRREAPPFAVLRDLHANLVPLVAPPAMPTSYILGRDGRVRYIHEGFHGVVTERDVRRELDALLAEKSASPAP